VLRKKLQATGIMILEEQRFLHEDLERLEQGISDRVAEDPRHVNNAFHVERAKLIVAESRQTESRS
jgi:hypothetical protein